MATAGKIIDIFFSKSSQMGYVWCIESCFIIGITISPQNDVVVPLNTSGVFVCKAESANTSMNWLIGFPGELSLPVDYYPTNELERRGVVVATMNTISTLRINGLPENNNTLVYCYASEGSQTSQEVAFRVFGKYIGISSVNTWKMVHYTFEFYAIVVSEFCYFASNLKFVNKFVQDRPAPQTTYPFTSSELEQLFCHGLFRPPT